MEEHKIILSSESLRISLKQVLNAIEGSTQDYFSVRILENEFLIHGTSLRVETEGEDFETSVSKSQIKSLYKVAKAVPHQPIVLTMGENNNWFNIKGIVV